MNRDKKSTKTPSKKSRNGRLVFTGFSMGLADLVPGVSGGTIALLYGVYDELLYSIRVVTGDVPRLALKGKIKETLALIPFAFLIPLVIGMLTAIFGFVQIITFLLDNYPVQIWSFFFGLILGSSFVVSKRISAWSLPRYIWLGLGFIVTYVIVGLPVLPSTGGTLMMLLTGAIAISAMVLPGISGSLIMVMLGQYENVIKAVEEFNVMLLGAFTLGAASGLALFSRLLSWLLREHHAPTIAFLVGVLLGSLRRVWPWQNVVGKDSFTNYLPDFSAVVVLAIALMGVGFLVVWQLEKLGIAEEHDDIDNEDFEREMHAQHD